MDMWDAARVRQLRKQLNLSQTEFADLLGCRQQTISEWEIGLYTPGNAYRQLLQILESRAPLSKPLSQPAASESFRKLDDSALGTSIRSDFDWTID